MVERSFKFRCFCRIALVLYDKLAHFYWKLFTIFTTEFYCEISEMVGNIFSRNIVRHIGAKRASTSTRQRTICLFVRCRSQFRDGDNDHLEEICQQAETCDELLIAMGFALLCLLWYPFRVQLRVSSLAVSLLCSLHQYFLHSHSF